jgi:uncharacterized RDD family membrane protein YckC
MNMPLKRPPSINIPTNGQPDWKPQKVGTQPKVVFNSSNHLENIPGGIGKRFIALILDGIILGVSNQIIIALVINKLFKQPIPNLVGQVIISFIAWPLIYTVGLTLKNGATPGKKLMGLRMVHAEADRELTFGTVFYREYFGKMISGLIFGLGFLSAFGDKAERRTWHDRMAKTRIIED